MGSKEKVALESAEGAECSNEVCGLIGIPGVVDQVVAGIRACASQNHYVVSATRIGDLHRPCGAAFGMAGGEMGGEDGGAELHVVPVVEDAVNLNGFELSAGVVVIKKVVAAAGLDDGDIGVHDLEPCVGEAFELCRAGRMVEVGLAVEQDFVSARRKPSASMFLRSWGTEEARLALIRMLPCGVVTR